MTRKKLLKFCSSAEFDRTVHQVTAKHSKELPRSILPLISLISNGALWMLTNYSLYNSITFALLPATKLFANNLRLHEIAVGCLCFIAVRAVIETFLIANLTVCGALNWLIF